MSQNKVYKMRFLKHLNYCWISLMFFLLSPVIFLIMSIIGKSDVSILIILIIWVFFSFLYLPGFILHFTYFKNDKNKSILIDEFSNITLIDKGNILKFNYQDLQSIVNYHSGINNRTPWNDYNYSTFKFNDGQEFVITCLAIDLEIIRDMFPHNKLIVKYFFYSSLSKRVLNKSNS